MILFQGYTALHLAVIQGRENVIASLFDSGKNVPMSCIGLKLTSSRFPFCSDEQNGGKQLSQDWTLISSNVKVSFIYFCLDYFLSYFFFSQGADVDVRDNSGRKPKHYINNTTSLWIQSK